MNKCIIPLQWQSAKEIYIPKVKPPTAHNISDFGPIALLNVEGKLFFSLVSRRLETHLISNNKIINKSVQKGCMEQVPGCWEHISMVWAALKEAKSKNLTLATIWLDIANAYGSIPHKLIIFALHRYGVSPMVSNPNGISDEKQLTKLLNSYYINIAEKSSDTKTFGINFKNTSVQSVRDIVNSYKNHRRIIKIKQVVNGSNVSDSERFPSKRSTKVKLKTF